MFNKVVITSRRALDTSHILLLQTTPVTITEHEKGFWARFISKVFHYVVLTQHFKYLFYIQRNKYLCLNIFLKIRLRDYIYHFWQVINIWIEKLVQNKVYSRTLTYANNFNCNRFLLFFLSLLIKITYIQWIMVKLKSAAVEESAILKIAIWLSNTWW